MTSLITLKWELERDAPPFEENDIKFPENLARYLIKNYTKKGDKVFDPFAGMGTTLFVAEEMSRDYFGIEAEDQKYQWVAGQLEKWMQHINDDAARMDKYNLPKMDLILTSPPYMPRHHKYNPLYGGDPKYAGYDKYLKRMRFIFNKCLPLMKINTPLIIQLDNLHHGKSFTPLIADVSSVLEKYFIQTDQVTVLWKKPKRDYPYTQYLVFKKR